MLMCDLTKYPVHHITDDSYVGRVEDVLLDMQDRKIVYLCVDLGGRFGHSPALIHWEHLKRFSDKLVVDIDVSQIKAVRKKVLSRHDDPVDLTKLPPIITGPFGYTISPSLLGTVGNMVFRRQKRQTDIEQAELPDGWIWGRDITGKPMFSEMGEIGRVEDLDIDIASNRVEQFILRKEGEQKKIPGVWLRHIPRGMGHLIARERRPGQPSFA